MFNETFTTPKSVAPGTAPGKVTWSEVSGTMKPVLIEYGFPARSQGVYDATKQQGLLKKVSQELGPRGECELARTFARSHRGPLWPTVGRPAAGRPAVGHF